MVKRRVASAAVGIPIVVAAILGGLPGIGTIVIIAAALAGWELASMPATEKRARAYYVAVPLTLVIASVVISATSDHSDSGLFEYVFGAAAGALAAFFAAAALRASGPVPYRARLAVVGAAYVGILLAHAPALAVLDDGAEWITIAILGTFAVDTGAFLTGTFFTGTALSRHRLAPAISPNKTWEGAVGGALAGIGAVIALNVIFGPDKDIWVAAVIGLALAIVGTSGDLTESWLKRRMDVKDSGFLIPGHGGILDRIDSLAPNLAVVYWAAVWNGA